VRDELTHESFVILERDYALVFVACNRLVELDAFLDQPLDPETNRAGQDREGRYGNLATTLPSATGIRPRKKGEDTSRIPLLVTEIEVIGSGIVEVYRTLDEPEAKNARVEVEIPLRVTGYTGDMMNTGSPEAHRPDSCLSFLWGLALVGAGTGSAELTAVTTFVLIRMRWDIFRVGLPGAHTGIAVALLCRGLLTLFLLSSGCHNISNRYPSIKATDMPFAEALM
jgi:hypothetical protein